MAIKLTKLFCQCNENSISNQISHSQIENDETPGAKYPNENDSEDRNKQKVCNFQLYAKNIIRL